MTPEIQKRAERLEKELSSAISHTNRRARLNYWTALVLIAGALLSSAAASLGAFTRWNNNLIGALALVPGIAALIETTLKFQSKSNWRYRKVDALNALRRRLLYELPEVPTADNVAAISDAWTSVTQSMELEWEKQFSLNWTEISQKHRIGKL